jgi:SIR2-like protein
VELLPDADRTLIDQMKGRIPLPDVSEVMDSLGISDAVAAAHFADALDDPRAEPSAYHDHLSALHPDVVITTNWDRLIEESMRRAGSRFRVIYRDEHLATYEPRQHAAVLKLHGTIEDPSSLVYRKSQYDRYWADRPLLSAFLTSLAATHSILFLGYGFGDPNVLELFERLRTPIRGLRREHWAFSYGDRTVEAAWQRIGVHSVPASDFGAGDRPAEATLTFLGALVGSSLAATYTNLDRARLINRELERQVSKNRPTAALRMRGALGWFSNPEPAAGDPMYGSLEQDVTERGMTELVGAFLAQNESHRVRCLLHIDIGPLLDQYQPHHLARRLRELQRWIVKFPMQLEVAHTPDSTNVNEVLFDVDAALLGYKKSDSFAMHHSVLFTDRVAVLARVKQFDRDFAHIAEDGALGTAPAQAAKDAREDVLRRIAQQLTRAEALISSA